MLYQHIKEELSVLKRQEADAKAHLVMRYLRNNHDEDLTDDRHDYDRAMQRLKKFLPADRTDEANRFSMLCYERTKVAIRYAWAKGMQLCWNVHHGHTLPSPLEELSVNEYLQLYKIEKMPTYNKLDEEVSAFSVSITEAGDGLCRFYDDIRHYYKNLEFEACRLAHYFGYLSMCSTLSDLDASFAEDGDFTLALEKCVENLLTQPFALAVVQGSQITQI